MFTRAILLVLYPLLHTSFSAGSQDLANDYPDMEVKNALPKFVYLTAPDKPPEEFLEDTEVAPGESEVRKAKGHTRPMGVVQVISYRP